MKCKIKKVNFVSLKILTQMNLGLEDCGLETSRDGASGRTSRREKRRVEKHARKLQNAQTLAQSLEAAIAVVNNVIVFILLLQQF